MQDLIVYIKKNYEKPGNELVQVILTFFLAFAALLFLKVGTLIFKQGDVKLYNYVLESLKLSTKFEMLLQRPWTIATYVFAQDIGFFGSFMRLFFEMTSVYILGIQFINFFNSKHFFKLYTTSILFGGSVMLLVSYFSTYIQQGQPLAGASIPLYSLMGAVATIMPKVPILVLQTQHFAAFGILFSFWNISNPSLSTRGIAQLAGILWGYLYVLYIRGDVKRFLQNWFGEIKKTSKSGRRTKKKFKVEYLLDKIAKDGYSSLTNEEKRALLESDQ